MNPIPLPPPYLGRNDVVPLIELEPPYCESFKNFNTDNATLTLRYGDLTWNGSANAAYTYLHLVGYGTTLFLVYDPGAGALRIANATSQLGAVDVYIPGGGGGDDEIHTLYFKGYLIFFGEVSWTPSGVGNPQYDGSAWSLSGLTYSGGFVPFGGGVYKQRGYLLGRGSTKYAYTNISAISGATTTVDLAQVVSQKANLYAIRSVSLSEGLEQETVLAFIFDSGEVLVYSGSYPDSASWRLVGQFFIPPPIYYNSVVEANGDVFVITKSALVSLRTLFTQGVDVAVQKGLSGMLPNRWQQIFQSNTNVYGIRGVYDDSRQRIVISLPNYVNESGTPQFDQGMRLIYSLKTNSWMEHGVTLYSSTSPGASFSGCAYVAGDVYHCANIYGNSQKVEKAEAAGEFMDNQLAFTYEMVSAPVKNGRAFVQECAGIDFIQRSDLYSQTEVSLISDLGVQTSSAQKIPDMGTSLVKAHANVGIEGSYIQYKISGTTVTGKSVGLELYGINFWAEQGTSPR